MSKEAVKDGEQKDAELHQQMIVMFVYVFVLVSCVMLLWEAADVMVSP